MLTNLSFRHRLAVRRPLGWFLSFLALVLAEGAGCKKEAPPSPEYAQAQALFATVYGQLLDDAFVDPRMDEVEALLKKVDPASFDFVAAQALEKRIKDARSQLEAENAKRKAAIAEGLKPTPAVGGGPTGGGSEPLFAEEAQAVPDAGAPGQPVPGMLISEFTGKFSRCFYQADKIEVFGRGPRDTWELKDLGVCRDLHPGFEHQIVIGEEGKILQITPRSAVRIFRLDAGFRDGGSPDAGLPLGGDR